MSMQTHHRGLLFLALNAVIAALWAVTAHSQAPSATPEPGETFRDCPSCSEMVVVPAGDFMMGATDTVYERPEHRVNIANPFAIGRREVTFEEWDACVAAGGCRHQPSDHGWGRGN